MYPVTITSQGQISLPVEARKKVGMQPGDRLLVVPVGNKLEISKDGGIESLRGIFAKFAVGKPRLTRKRLEQLREEMYTERYKRFLKQNEKSNS